MLTQNFIHLPMEFLWVVDYRKQKRLQQIQDNSPDLGI